MRGEVQVVIDGLRQFRDLAGRDAGLIADLELQKQLLPKGSVLWENGRLSFRAGERATWSYYRLPSGFELSRKISWEVQLNVRVRNGVEMWSVDPGEGRPERSVDCRRTK